ncbi:hypothetical protein HO173_000254 [Letharia columbiana]|uniref:Serine-rich protein n=1 Tax=Letharia columbiana TaxID=112416 RepID=A0A8H6LA83_9LECA|nr:uncharacterized protein HO173_000254 [Letharia columbiana]KAF6241543.1 hypothetical protein HO173_000254 [Letharia columbiana]
MNLPLRPSKGSPPRRAALHERSDSHTNERASPTLRIIGDPQAQIYASSPFPTKPSHILSPKVYDGPGSTFAPGVYVPNDRKPQRETKDNVEDPLDTTTSYLQRRSGSADTKDPFYTAAQGTTPGPDTSTSFLAMDEGMDSSTGRVSDDIVQLPSISPALESSELYGTANLMDAPHQPVSKDSDASLSSSNSTGTVIVKRTRDGRGRASYSAFPNTARPGSSKSNLSISTPQKPVTRDTGGSSSPVSPISPSSPVSPNYAMPHERRISSVPLYANLHASGQNSLNLQYPVIRPPSASASWVEPPNSTARRPSRTLERNQDRWNPHLSTVPSEGTGSQSEGRSSHTPWISESSRVSKSSFTTMNPRGGSDMPPLPSQPSTRESSNLPSLANPPAVLQRDVTGSTIRVVKDLEDDLPTPLPPIPGSRGSEYLGVASGDNRYSVVTKRGSKASFFRDSIPAWAKAYYARPLSATSTSKDRSDRRPSTSTENISLNMFRPRTRAKDADDQRRRSSLMIGRVRHGGLDLAEVRGPSRQRPSSNWSPHLWHNRASLSTRRTIFQAPSLDEQAEGNAPSKRTAQILLFAVGFIFPPAWFIAAFLPLPPRPAVISAKGKDVNRQPQMLQDLEKQLGAVDEARYENARWWRNINRVMSGFGVLIIVAIIALVAVAAN